MAYEPRGDQGDRGGGQGQGQDGGFVKVRGRRMLIPPRPIGVATGRRDGLFA